MTNLIDAFYPEPFEYEGPVYCKQCDSCGIPDCCPNSCAFFYEYIKDHQWYVEELDVYIAADRGNLMAKQLVAIDEIW